MFGPLRYSIKDELQILSVIAKFLLVESFNYYIAI